jgi:glycosyltransferase involved in cell wall biosynthesis
LKRVAIYLISDGIGGAEQVVWQTIHGLSGDDSIYLIVNNEIASFYRNLMPDARFFNIGDIFLHSKKKYRFIRYFLNNRLFSYLTVIIRYKSKGVADYLINNKIEILHSHLDYALYSSIHIKKKKKNLKIFCTVHGASGLIDDKLLNPSLPLSNIDFGSIDKLIFVSRYMYNLYKEKNIPINEAVIIFNGIDYKYTADYSRPVKTNRDYTILYVGGSKYIKGYDILVETIDLLRKSNPEFRFHVDVLGHVSDNCNLVKMIRQSGIEQYFNLVGFVAPPLHIDYFKCADILFMPSRSEALPIAAIEAISLNLPVIASNIGGLPEVIEDGLNGLLSDPESLDFVLKITKMLTNYGHYLESARESNKDFCRKFDAVTMCKMYLELYKGTAIL